MLGWPVIKPPARRRGKSRDSRMLDWDDSARLTPLPAWRQCQSGTRSIPAAKSALRRGEITPPTRRHGLMALFQHPPHRLTTYHV